MKESNQNNEWMKYVEQIETSLEEIFGKKAPEMPKKAKEVIVEISPYLVVLMLLLSLPGILALFGIGTYMTSWMHMGYGFGNIFRFNVLINLVVSGVVVVMTLMAVPGMFKKEKRAWKLMFWLSLVSAVGALLRLDLGSLIIGSALSWYVLFQIKSYYKN